MMTMKLAAVVAAAALATGCATSQQTGALTGAIIGGVIGGGVGAGAGAWAAGAGGVVIGALVGGAIGKHMDKHDHEKVTTVVQTSKSESWTSKSGVQMTAETKDLGTDKKELTVTAGDKVEKTVVVKKGDKWVRE